MHATCMLLAFTSLTLLGGMRCLLRGKAELCPSPLATCCLFVGGMTAAPGMRWLPPAPPPTTSQREWGHQFQLSVCSPNGCMLGSHMAPLQMAGKNCRCRHPLSYKSCCLCCPAAVHRGPSPCGRHTKAAHPATQLQSCLPACSCARQLQLRVIHKSAAPRYPPSHRCAPACSSALRTVAA